MSPEELENSDPERKNRMKELSRHTSFGERKQNARLHSNYVVDTSIPLAGPTADRACRSWVHLSTEEVRHRISISKCQHRYLYVPGS